MVFASLVLTGSVMIVLSKHVIKNRHYNLQVVQAAHINSVTRIGGIAIVCALVLSLAFQFGDIHQVNLSSKLLLSTVLIFFMNKSEDLGLMTSPRIRFFPRGAIYTHPAWSRASEWKTLAKYRWWC